MVEICFLNRDSENIFEASFEIVLSRKFVSKLP